ncbi:tRNA-specific 2-thiouridylase MnmA [Striga asiatica]|uniref:tRNA-specific 2-thiouridylase MnmA n=1 Tax=Striga asiatica TaxID=4170 RepID=A0A5A7PCU6_STRAF|nr:tRNA-specific 2-thiouridylase MnmA [Striga asiatica]
MEWPNSLINVPAFEGVRSDVARFVMSSPARNDGLQADGPTRFSGQDGGQLSSFFFLIGRRIVVPLTLSIPSRAALLDQKMVVVVIGGAEALNEEDEVEDVKRAINWKKDDEEDKDEADID